jgi:hypothetical protein
MSTRNRWLVLGTVGVALALAVPSGRGASGGRQNGSDPTVTDTGAALIEHREAERKAGDPVSTRALVDAVFEFPHVYRRMSQDIENAAKGRITNAEIRYEAGNSPPVEEQDVVDLANSVAQRLGAPEYAFTNASQVRSLRMRMALNEPKFMGAGMARPGAAIGEEISSSMSPLQAVHLLACLIDQKFANPEFQVTPAEWDQATHTVPVRSGGPARGALRVMEASPKRREMYDLYDRSVQGLSVADGALLLNEALLKLRIP